MRRFVRHIAIVSVFSALLAGAGAASHAQNLRAVDIEALERTAERLIAEQIDAERARLAPEARRLASDPALDEIARDRSDAMAHGAPFAHEDGEGTFLAAAKVREHFGPYGAIGENIMMEQDTARAFDAQAFARRAVQGWMGSEGHRANILSNRYDHEGVGVVINGSYAYATQVFWGPPPRAPQRPLGTRRR
jgi:uncharacterized protein YkwD